MQALLDPSSNLTYVQGLLRALLGAMVFALPMMMTLEMWELGFTIEAARLALLLTLTFPMLVGLSFYAGFEPTFSLVENVLDAFAAIAVGAAAAVAVLALFGEIGPDISVRGGVGKVALLSFAAAIGALLADKQFNDKDGSDDEDASERIGASHSYMSRLFVMSVGAIFLALNIAPTEEVVLIAAQMSAGATTMLALVSVATLGAILSAVDTAGGAGGVVRRTFAGYGLCLMIAGYVLWTFGRMDGAGLSAAMEEVVVLAFPAALGAGAARLMLGSKSADDE